jgi:cell division transport system permease protein
MRRIQVLPRDGGGRLLALVVAVMTFLAGLGLGGGIMVAGAVEGWTGTVVHRLTVQVPPGIDPSPALYYLRTYPGIAGARLLTDSDLGRLLSPWLGDGVDLGRLPVPHLIDVMIDPSAPPNEDGLRSGLDHLAPGARIDDHRAWLSDVLHLAALARALCFAVAGLVALATVAIVVFATRAGLTQHRDVVDVLHLIGARDGAVAGAFERQVAWIAFQGAFFGAGAAGVTLYGLGRAALSVGDPLLIALAPDMWTYIGLTTVPVITAGLAMITGRLTVLRLLDAAP